MYFVKIFYNSSEEKIQAWLNDQEIVITSVTQSSATGRDDHVVTEITIFYTKKSG